MVLSGQPRVGPDPGEGEGREEELVVEGGGDVQGEVEEGAEQGGAGEREEGEGGGGGQARGALQGVPGNMRCACNFRIYRVTFLR